MKLNSPSFKLKNSDHVIFSNSGKLLAQKGSSGTKISIWDVENRKLIAQYKIIPNDDSIGFLPDEQTMFVKNKNGELAFFKTFTGELVSKTGKNPLYGAGSNSIFNAVDNYLYDASWQGELLAWNIKPLVQTFKYEYKNHMITVLTRSNKTNLFYAAVIPTVYAPMFGGAKLLQFSTLSKQYDPQWLLPKETFLKDSYGNWKPIVAMEFNSNLIMCLQLSGLKEPPIIVNHDVSTGKSKFSLLDSQYQSVWSVTSNDSVIITVVKTNTYRKGMTTKESIEAKLGVETDHLYIHDKNSLELIAKIFWPDIFCVCFKQDGKGIAIASSSKSAYIADYQSIFKLNAL